MLKDNRMKEIYSMVRASSERGVCDVGTDHAHIPIELIRKKKVPFAIATDISLPSLQKGERNIAALGLSDGIETFCANGTLGVPLDSIGDIIIAGMGGELISEILFSDPRLHTPDLHFILQPMTKHSELRVLLAQHGFRIDKESCVSDGDRIYFIMSVFYTGVSYTLTLRDKLLGIRTEKNTLLIEYAQSLYDKMKIRLHGLESASTPQNEEIGEIKDVITELEKFINV